MIYKPGLWCVNILTCLVLIQSAYAYDIEGEWKTDREAQTEFNYSNARLNKSSKELVDCTSQYMSISKSVMNVSVRVNDCVALSEKKQEVFEFEYKYKIIGVYEDKYVLETELVDSGVKGLAVLVFYDDYKLWTYVEDDSSHIRLYYEKLDSGKMKQNR